jgi:hypothetical protein
MEHLYNAKGMMWRRLYNIVPRSDQTLGYVVWGLYYPPFSTSQTFFLKKKLRPKTYYVISLN